MKSRQDVKHLKGERCEIKGSAVFSFHLLLFGINHDYFSNLEFITIWYKFENMHKETKRLYALLLSSQ